MAQNVKKLSSGTSSETPYLEQVSGSERGKVFELAADRLTIGRSDNNDIVIVSEAVSRYHAVFERESDGAIVVKDNQSKNGILVNGNNVPARALSDGDVVQIGDFVFRCHLPAAPDAVEGSYHNGMNEAAYGKEVGYPAPAKRRSNRPLIYGVAAMVLGYVYYVSQSDTKPATDTTTTPTANNVGGSAKLVEPTLDVQKEQTVPQLEDPALSKVEQKLDKMDLNNGSIREAESYFRKGQREYMNQNYHRAIEEFRAAVSLYRNHELAQYYLKLSIYQVELEAKKNMEMGQKYFESMQYTRAMGNFKQVILLMDHRPTDPMVSNAEKYIIQCERRLQAAEQFP